MTTFVLTESLVFLRLSFHFPSQSRKLPAQEDIANLVGATEERLRTFVSLFSPKALQPIHRTAALVKAQLLQLVLPVTTDFPGTFILPRALLAQAEAQLQTGQRAFQAQVDTFIDSGAYAEEQEKARTALGSAFSQDDYPPADQLRERFAMAWRYVTLEPPEGLPADVQAQEYAKFQENLQKVASDCRQALREGFAALVTHLAERLTPAADGRKKRLAATTVENLQTFLGVLDSRDITGDTDLRVLGAQARRLLDDVSVDDLRKDGDLAAYMRQGLEAVSEQLEPLIRPPGARRFDFSEDDTPVGAASAA